MQMPKSNPLASSDRRPLLRLPHHQQINILCLHNSLPRTASVLAAANVVSVLLFDTSTNADRTVQIDAVSLRLREPVRAPVELMTGWGTMDDGEPEPPEAELVMPRDDVGLCDPLLPPYEYVALM